MTIDKAKLKALAEAATQSQGARRVEVDHNGVHVVGDGSWKILSAWHTPDGKGAQNAEFAAAASPATILALLAEVEQLAFEPAKHSRRLIDQLKAENEDYKSGQERYEQIIEDLKAEIEALRKDAERYRWLRDDEYLHAWADLHVCDEHRRAEVTDKAIDAAMAKEASHG